MHAVLSAGGRLPGTKCRGIGSTHFHDLNAVHTMSSKINELADELTEDLYEKTRTQLRTFLDETNALLAAGDALNEDRTSTARERLAAFLASAERSVAPPEFQPPVSRAIVQAKGYVMDHPWTAVGIAAGAGLVVSMLLNRRQP